MISQAAQAIAYEPAIRSHGEALRPSIARTCLCVGLFILGTFAIECLQNGRPSHSWARYLPKFVDEFASPYYASGNGVRFFVRHSSEVREAVTLLAGAACVGLWFTRRRARVRAVFFWSAVACFFAAAFLWDFATLFDFVEKACLGRFYTEAHRAQAIDTLVEIACGCVFPIALILSAGSQRLRTGTFARAVGGTLLAIGIASLASAWNSGVGFPMVVQAHMLAEVFTMRTGLGAALRAAAESRLVEAGQFAAIIVSVALIGASIPAIVGWPIWRWAVVAGSAMLGLVALVAIAMLAIAEGVLVVDRDPSAPGYVPMFAPLLHQMTRPLLLLIAAAMIASESSRFDSRRPDDRYSPHVSAPADRVAV